MGVDLAWSPKNATGLAVATVSSDEVAVQEATTVTSNAGILSFIRRFASGPLTIAIDAPTIVPNQTGMRPVERRLQSTPEFQKASAAPFPANRERLGEYNNGVPRGEELVTMLRREFGIQEIGCPPARHQAMYAMEVFPLAAMPRLFGAPFIYKAKKGRTPQQCQDGLSSYLAGIRNLRDPAISIPDDLRVNGHSGGKLKDLEDRADAVLCAYIAALAWLGKAEAVGDLETGYIVLPLPRSPKPIMENILERPLSSRFDEALRFAADIHRHQPRKGTQIPYMAHILGVTSIALEYGADEDEAIGAVLHDTIEDAPVELGAEAVRRFIRLKFGERVLAIVEACTDADIKPKPPWRTRKEAYVASIAHKDASALLVSAADKLHNADAILTDFRNVGISVFDRFNAEAKLEDTLWYYEELVKAISTRAASVRDPRIDRLTSELSRVVRTLREEVRRQPGNGDETTD